MDIYEDKDALIVRVELPGMQKADIDVSLHDGGLSISGERKSQQQSEDTEVYRSERFFGRFQRSVTLPTLVAADKVKAEYTDGILSVTLPKAEEAKPKHIDVQVS
jgi:HSP20 family protein